MYYGDYPKSYSKPVCLGERRCLKGPLPIVCLNCFFWNYNYVQSFSIGIFWDYRNCYFFNYKYGFSNRAWFYKK